MDEYFGYFLKNFGPIIERHEVPAESLETYHGKLPDQLLLYWQEYGWSGFAQGLFWLVNPAEWDDTMEIMLEDSGLLERDAFHVIARNAFGDLWLWGEKTGPSVTVISCAGMIFPNFDVKSFNEHGPDTAMKYFFTTKKLKDVDLLNDKQELLFTRALEKHGTLKADEMYGFVPFVGSGGECMLKNLQKVEALVHMEILAEMTPMKAMPDYCEIARNQGLM